VNSESKTVMIRISSTLADTLDLEIDENNLFLNKPDFIMWAIRLSYSDMIKAMVGSSIVGLLEIIEPIRVDLNSKYWKSNYSSYIMGINAYRGKYRSVCKDKNLKSIALHIPVGLYQELEELINLSSVYSSLQDFIRVSIVYGLNKLNKEYEQIEALSSVEEDFKALDEEKIIKEYLTESNRLRQELFEKMQTKTNQ